MPNRIIRGDLLDSESYGSVNDSARLFFIHLCLLADDLGCVSLAPVFLRRRAFIRYAESQEVDHLLSMLMDADLVRIYEAGGARYGFIPKFRQRLQRAWAKHPQPPVSLYQDDEHALSQFNKINNLTKKSTVGQPIDNRSTTDIQPPEVEVEVEEKRESAPKAKGSRLAVDALPDDWREWCSAQAPHLDPAKTFDRFSDYWKSVSGSKGVKLDWFATWRNWCRNEKGSFLQAQKPHTAPALRGAK